MRILLAIMGLLAVATSGRAQAVLLRGAAFASDGGTVRIEVNDTLRKVWRTVPDQPEISKQDRQLAATVAEQTQKLMNERKYVLTTDSLGQFSVLVRPQDSLVFSAYHHHSQRVAVRDLLRQPQAPIRLAALPCQDYVECREPKPAHYVFIGRKKSVSRVNQPYYCNTISMDSKFAARYQVLENVHNTLPDSMVEFVAYDHYGWPGFSHHQTALLFVSRYCGEYVHQKYLYYPLYKTLDGRWAAPVMANDLQHPAARSVPKPRKIAFATPVEIDVTDFDPEQVKQYYPAPYYRLVGTKAIAEYGNHVEELVEIQKRTVLKARGVKL